MKAQWFSLSHLPDLLIWWHRYLYIKDALENKSSVVRRIDIPLSFSHLTRQELYDLKDQGELNVNAIVAEICAPVDKQHIHELLG